MKLGIAGNGNIVAEMLEATQSLTDLTITAIAVRPQSKNKGVALAERYHIPAVFTDYQEFLRTADIDCVYIAVPNSLHFSYTHQALQAHHHVICEKPFTLNSGELRQLQVLAEQHHCLLLEAITSIHSPNFAKLQELLPLIAPLRLVQANFSQYSSRYNQYLNRQLTPVFDPQLGGGALYDLSIYNLHVIIGLLGSPEQVTYTPNLGYNGVDTSGVVVLDYGKALTAVSVAAKDSASPSGILLQGERGYIRVKGTPNAMEQLELSLPQQVPQIIDKQGPVHRMVPEFKEFIRIIHEQDEATAHRLLTHSIAVMEAVEQAALALNR